MGPRKPYHKGEKKDNLGRIKIKGAKKNKKY